MLSVVTFKWETPGYRTRFTAEHVNALYRGVARHYAGPYRPICVTDDANGVDDGIEIVPMWDDFADVPSPHGRHNPSCYRRLKLFDPAMSDVIGPRFVALDLDCLVTGDLAPLFDRPVDFAMWRDPYHRSQYNGSLLLMKTGAKPFVWADFDPATSPSDAFRAGYMGSDQGWVSYRVGRGQSTFVAADGVYSYRYDVRGSQALPANARLVFFHGKEKAWDDGPYKHSWVRAACH